MFLEKSKWENTNKESMRLCKWVEGRNCAEERKNVFIVEERERRDVWVH